MMMICDQVLVSLDALASDAGKSAGAAQRHICRRARM